MKQGPALLLLLTVALTACSGLAGEPQVLATLTPVPRAPADLASGARIFAARCSSCHGSSGAGDGELALSGAIPAPGNFTQPEAARATIPATVVDDHPRRAHRGADAALARRAHCG